MSYKVQTQVYSGPFDLLLKLVTRQKVDIGAISIAQVADQYLDELDAMGDMDLEVASDFVLVASTLLDIKAASLVPSHTEVRAQDDEDEEDEFSNLTPDQARDVLIARLIAYKKFRNAASALHGRMESEARMVPRTAGADPEFLGLMPDYLEGISLKGLAVICADLLSKQDSFLLEANHIAPKKIPLALTVVNVDRMTIDKPVCTFSDLLQGKESPEAIVVTFLAMLELFKRGSIKVAQKENFSEIHIERIEGAKPFDLEHDAYLSIDEEM